mmetsp:Transcript_18580/g.30413  ORF Transcript_18580/g.30413 Transcript_18580/m.30413 type:complete len:418 (+) Transcript_18580:73-1326(+)
MILWQKLLLLYYYLAHPAYGDQRSSSSLANLSSWAKQHGTTLHPAVQWVDYGDGDWGLQLTSKVDRGTELVRVPRSIVLDSVVSRDEIISSSTSVIENANECIIDALGPFQVHEENFWIVLKLYQCLREERNGKHAPWIEAMPRKFRHFSKEEEDCLPFYAKYIADYQRQKLDAFVDAASVICGHKLEGKEKEQFTWAFDAVGSRFWKTTSTIKEDYQPRSELVPVGDMFNHREPPNVKLYHDNEGDAVCFLYLGENDDTEDDKLTCYPKDLLITYGLGYNPHRFLVIFGFVPTDMKEIWCHFVFSDDNPYSVDVSKMVFQCKDGSIPQDVWDAVLYELDPSKDIELMRHDPMAKFYAAEVLNNHVAKQLEELASLREKIDFVVDGENLDLIKMHNHFLTDAFHRVQSNLKAELGKH